MTATATFNFDDDYNTLAAVTVAVIVVDRQRHPCSASGLRRRNGRRRGGHRHLRREARHRAVCGRHQVTVAVASADTAMRRLSGSDVSQ